MATTMYFDGPAPPEGHYWCSICAMFGKQAFIEANQEAIQAAHRGSDDDPPIRFDMGTLDGSELRVAVTRAFSPQMPQLGLLDLCWSHAAGIMPMIGGITPASPQEAISLSGAAQIGSRRPR